MFAALFARIGLKLLLGKALSNAASDGRAALTWLKGLNAMQLLALALGVALAVDHVALVMAHRHGRKVEAQLLVTNKALTMSRANEDALKKAIADQNAAIADLGQKSAEQQSEAAKALGRAQSRVSASQAVIDRLRSSAAQRPAGAPCTSIDAVKEQWK